MTSLVCRPRFIARAALVASCVAAGLPSTAAAGTACPPVAIVEGAAEIVTPVAAVLRRRGLRSEPSGCGRVVRASLVTRPDLKAYSLHIEDGYGRVSDREIADASTAASLIESWAIDEDADVLGPRPAPAPVQTLVAAPPPPAGGAPAGFRVTTLGEVSTATDGSTWYGGALAACGRVGPICLGGRARIARGGGDEGGGLPVSLARARTDAGAAVALPLSWGGFTAAPMIGVGLTWTRTTMATSQVPVQMTSDDYALGVEAGVGLAFGVSAHWSLVGELGGLLTRSLSRHGGGDVLWDFLPAPPTGFVHVGAGLEYAR
jgi:hypothetical protein